MSTFFCFVSLYISPLEVGLRFIASSISQNGHSGLNAKASKYILTWDKMDKNEGRNLFLTSLVPRESLNLFKREE